MRILDELRDSEMLIDCGWQFQLNKRKSNKDGRAGERRVLGGACLPCHMTSLTNSPGRKYLANSQ